MWLSSWVQIVINILQGNLNVPKYLLSDLKLVKSLVFWTEEKICGATSVSFEKCSYHLSLQVGAEAKWRDLMAWWGLCLMEVIGSTTFIPKPPADVVWQYTFRYFCDSHKNFVYGHLTLQLSCVSLTVQVFSSQQWKQGYILAFHTDG